MHWFIRTSTYVLEYNVGFPASQLYGATRKFGTDGLQTIHVVGFFVLAYFNLVKIGLV